MGKNSMLRLTFFVLLNLFTFIQLLASNYETGNPLLSNYSSRDYQANPSNMSIVQDQRGVMYFGNADGVLEFDGVSWRLIPLPNHTIARSLAYSPTGRIYVGSVGEFGFLAPDSLGNLTYFSLIPEVPEKERSFLDVWAIHVTSNGAYFRTASAIYHWDDFRIKIIKPQTKFHTSYVVHDQIYTRQWDVGLMKILGDSLILVSGGEKFANERIYALLPYGKDNFLVGTRTQGLFLYNSNSFQSFPSEVSQFLIENQLYCGAVLKNNTFALGTNRGGVVVIDSLGRFLGLLNKETGLPDEAINEIFMDRQSNIWLALDDGLSRIEFFSPLTYFDETNGLEGGVNDILRHRGQLYFATSLGVFYLQPDEKKHSNKNALRRQKFLPVTGIETQCWDLLAFNEQLLVATGEGLYRIQNNHAALIKQSERRDFYAWNLVRSKLDSNLIYVGLDDGLAIMKWENKEWHDQGNLPGIVEDIRAIVENPDGSLWLGKMRAGIMHVENPQISKNQKEIHYQRFGVEHGLPEGKIAVYQTQKRPVFTSKGGIFYFEPKSQRFHPDSTFGVEFTRKSCKIGMVVSDSLGNVWIGVDAPGELNVARPNPEDLYSLERTPFLQIPNGEFFAIYPENNGVVWFVTQDNLFRFYSNIKTDYPTNFPVLIRQVIVNDDSVIFGGTETLLRNTAIPKLESAQNRLRFEFAAPFFEGEAGNQFQTFLTGFDKDWSKWSQESIKEYSNLPFGDYKFQVRAKNVFENIGHTADYRFSILPPWYRTWWAYTIYILILLLGIFAVDRFQRTRLIRREQEKAKMALLEAENRRKSEELEKARQLQLSMLPSEIPQLPNLDIAAYMKTATEVGGDYYDFHLCDDGTLTVAIGDATNHGLNAGMMVTATKSLFNTLAHQSDIPKIFNQSNKILKRMQLRGLYMALLILKIKENQATVCSAGMPPLLIHRAATNQVEEITTKCLPLGGISNYECKTRTLALSPGDTILLLSDGFPERFNGHSEILGYEKAVDVLKDVAQKSSKEIIQHFVEVGNAWADHHPLNDDVTFVVLKVKNGEG